MNPRGLKQLFMTFGGRSKFREAKKKAQENHTLLRHYFLQTTAEGLLTSLLKKT